MNMLLFQGQRNLGQNSGFTIILDFVVLLLVLLLIFFRNNNPRKSLRFILPQIPTWRQRRHSIPLHGDGGRRSRRSKSNEPNEWAPQCAEQEYQDDDVAVDTNHLLFGTLFRNLLGSPRPRPFVTRVGRVRREMGLIIPPDKTGTFCSLLLLLVLWMDVWRCEHIY